jgi:hypothetical protein
MKDNYLVNIKYLPVIDNAGPWNTEPDILLWEYKNTLCLIYRHPDFYTLNGYITTDVVEEALHGVHGEITYTGDLPVLPEHIALLSPYVDDNKSRWVGFDTAHAWDYLPKHGIDFIGSIYKDLDYVKREVEKLVDMVTY